MISGPCTRVLGRDRGMALVAVLSLALGIGANAAIFSVAHAFLLRVWQVRDPQTLVFVRARSTDGERIADFPWTTVNGCVCPPSRWRDSPPSTD